MRINPDAINAGNLIYNETFRSFAVNNTALDVELRYDNLIDTGGVTHTPVAVPLKIPAGGQHVSNVTVSPEGPVRIDATLQLDFLFDVQAQVAARKGYGPMIYNGLIANAYHPGIGRGGYFHENSGTSEGQGVMILAAFRAFEALRESDPETAEFYREMALSMLSSLSEFDDDGPVLRQPIPEDPSTITLLHGLFAAKGPVQLQNVVLDHVATLSNGTLTLPSSVMGDGLVMVYQLYPANSELLYPSLYSPVIGGGSVKPTNSVENPDGSVTVTAAAPDGQYKVVFSNYSTASLPQGTAYEAYPVWSAIPDGYAACAPDTFRWFDTALDLAVIHGPPKDATKWLRLRDALRQTVVKGQTITDLREVIRPMPRVGVFATDGMFCDSNNPNALVPSAESGLEPGWIGYNFWRRDPDNGNIVGEIPLATTSSSEAGESSTQIGRGFADTWRGLTTYQEADQFLLVEMGVRMNQNISTSSQGSVPNFRPYISTTREYNAATRYYAASDAAAFVNTWTWEDNGLVKPLLFPRSAFKNSLGETFPLNGQILNFGLDLRAPKTIGYSVFLRELRLVSGPSAQWVIDNLDTARKGSQLPYFPGSLPFAINADLKAQEFVGYNGNPFQGYQLPDLWLRLSSEAELLHPSLTSADMPTANPNTGEFRWPVSMTNANGAAKPTHIALMEQQLLFLRDAADVYFRDHAIRGPFAHTFVLNTPARFNIGGPAPHTWVYTNDDPDTRWAGYQVRVVESLADIVRQTQGVEYAEDAYLLARTQAVNWLTWLNNAWPDLNGSPYKGMPTDFPGVGAPQTLYEELHSPAIILRACLFLKQGSPQHAALCDAVMKRCWDYMEMFWNTSGEMAYTWSPQPANRWWYGFWHAEILWTLSVMLTDGRSAVATGISLYTVRERLVKTSEWLRVHGELDARHRVDVQIDGFRAELIGADPNWANGYSVNRTYMTDVFESSDGEQQRRALRETPRKRLEFSEVFTFDRLRDFQTTLSYWQDKFFMAPELTKFVRTAERISVGSAGVLLEEVPDWLIVGSPITLVSLGDAEALSVGAIVGNRVIFTNTSRNEWPRGTKLCHAVMGYLSADFNLSRPTDRVATGLLTLDVLPGSELLPPVVEVPYGDELPGLTEYPGFYNRVTVPINTTDIFFHDGLEIFLIQNNWGEPVTEGRSWATDDVDFGFGRIDRKVDLRFGVRRTSRSITCHTPERVKFMADFFDRMRGAQGNFWMPTWEPDLEARGPLLGERREFRVTLTRTLRLLLGNEIYRSIAVITQDRRLLTNTLTGVTYEGETALLSVRDPWPIEVPEKDIHMVCWMPAWRLTPDEQTFQWLTDTVAQVPLDAQTDNASRVTVYPPKLYTSLIYPQVFSDDMRSSSTPEGLTLETKGLSGPNMRDRMASSSEVTGFGFKPGLVRADPISDEISSSSAVVGFVFRDLRLDADAGEDRMNTQTRVVDGVLKRELVSITPFEDDKMDTFTTVVGGELT